MVTRHAKKKAPGKGVRMILLAAALCFLGMTPVPDTGQDTCYDANGNVLDPCPAPGEDFYGQDAQYTCNPMSFTKLDSSGNALPDSATEWAMVKDNVTGLIWEVKHNKDGNADYSNPNDADNEYTWYDSNPDTNGGDAGSWNNGKNTQEFIKALNDAKYGGHDDWRMPTPWELQTIVDYGEYDPAIDQTFFPGTQSSDYWSSSTGAGYPGYAWRADFYYGYVGGGYDKSCDFYVRAVRKGQ